MEIRFKAQASELIQALAAVSLVQPRPITPKGGSGYLFVVRGDRCFLYSRDSLRVSRADFAIEDVQGEGSFIYPSDSVGLLERAGDGDITFTASSEGDVHKVGIQTHAGRDTRTTFDPRLMATCDKDIEAAKDEQVFYVGILKEALRQAKPFLSGDDERRAEDQFKTVQIFDASKPEWAKGDGVLYAASGTIAFYFQSEAFQGKGLAVHGQHLGALNSFLGRASGQVTIRKGQNMTFASDSKGRVLGWTHHEKMHGKYSYYGLSNDTYVFDVPVSAVLSTLKYMQAGLGSKRDKIRVKYEAANPQLVFWAAEGHAETESTPVPVIPHEGSKEEELSFFVNINHLIYILSDAKGDRLMLRITLLPKNEKRNRDQAMIRTIDSFLLDENGKVVPGNAETKPEGAFACQVTRFVPSKD